MEDNGKKDPSKSKDRAYEVGYQKPPVSTRFAKGVSGNPKGRSRGRKSLRASLQEILGQKVATRVGDKIRSMSKADAILSMMVNAGLKGDFGTGLKTLSLAGRLETDAAKEAQHRKVRPMDLNDEEVIQLFIERKITFSAVMAIMTDEQVAGALAGLTPPAIDPQ